MCCCCMRRSRDEHGGKVTSFTWDKPTSHFLSAYTDAVNTCSIPPQCPISEHRLFLPVSMCYLPRLLSPTRRCSLFKSRRVLSPPPSRSTAMNHWSRLFGFRTAVLSLMAELVEAGEKLATRREILRLSDEGFLGMFLLVASSASP